MALEGGSSLGPYVIKSALGAGGMGEVYRARDLKLARDVAIKVLSSELSADARFRARFEREARAVAALNHANIITVHDFGESNGRLYIAFELIEGITLDQRLANGRLPLPLALDFAIQMADALAHAHTAGVIHRDLKPRNVMVTAEGKIKILDFGLGKFVRSPEWSADATTTHVVSEAGYVLGTVGYMSPEQASGEEADARSDQFVFGAVLYEMLSGIRAFKRKTILETMTAIVDGEPAPLRDLVPQAPPALLRVVGRCLAKRPSDRYAVTRDLLADLRAIAADAVSSASGEATRRPRHAAIALALIAAAAVLVAAGIWRGQLSLDPRTFFSSPASAIETLSVLPFASSSNDPADLAYWAGLTQSVTSRLAALPAGRRIHVTPAGDVIARSVGTIRDAYVELGASHVIRGRPKSEGTTTQVQLELVAVSPEHVVRTVDVSVTADERAVLQNRLVDAILGLIEIQLSPEERARLTVAPATAGARDFYLQGLGYLQDDGKAGNIESAIQVFEQALKLDPKHAPSYAGLGEAYWRRYLANRDPQWAAAARQTCERALGLDERESSPHSCLGTVANGIGEYEKAAEEFQHALQREPDSEVAYIGLANAYDRMGLAKQAEETYLKAISVRPRYWNGYSRLGAFYYAKRRYADAERMFKEVIALHPDSWRGYSNLGALFYVQERTADAIAAFEKSLAIRPNYQAASNLGTLYFFDARDYPRAAGAFQQAVDLDKDEYVVWGNLASALMWAGRLQEAQKAYAKAAELAKARLMVNPRDPRVTMTLAEYEANIGHDNEAHALMDRALMLAPDDARLMFQAGVLWEYWFHDRSKAFDWLGRSLRAGYQWKEVERSPALAELRKDSRIDQLRRQATAPVVNANKGA